MFIKKLENIKNKTLTIFQIIFEFRDLKKIYLVIGFPVSDSNGCAHVILKLKAEE